MTPKEFYNKIKKLAPYKTEYDKEFRDVLIDALNKYQKQLSEVEIQNIDKIKNDVRNIIKEVNEIIKSSYCGLPSTAYNQLDELINSYFSENDILYADVNANKSFYRMRIGDNRRIAFKYKEMFHIPIKMRRQISTQRFSTPGYPCLYIGSSIYVCWEELGRPRMSDCWVSRLENIEPFKLLDLRIPREKDFKSNFEDYAKLFPIIISCMIPVINNNDTYKPEYILPQLITEWIIQTKNAKGIYYNSTMIGDDFDYPKEKLYNIAMPVKDPLKDKVYCSDLKNLFKITDPVNNEIEQLKCPYDIIIDGGDASGIDGKVYYSSNFGNLEERLSPKYKKLHNIE